ncbi:MAG: hypothetical protein LBO07_07770 [Coriobacteriales bacterium]|nr:hypothetical protein [Coriobacteriales bacterium]
MNPVIIIPTYVGGRRRTPSYDVVATYDHATPLTHQGELPRCLASLRDNGIEAPVILLVAAEPGVEDMAAQKIHEIADAYREHLSLTVVDAALLEKFYDIASSLGFERLSEGVSLTGYGAIRNLGLAVAAICGFTEVIFIDDDEVVIDSTFLKKAMYGLGKLSKKGVPVLVKSGFFIDRQGNWKSSQRQAWYNRYWEQGKLFNEWIGKAMSGPRLSRSNSLYGGLMAIHREAYRRVAFDPWISRGEDLDYLLNLRMYGGGVWFDNKWSIQHLPPLERNEAQRFRQDIYRWIYEHRKLEYSKSQIDLLQIAPHSLDPYPGPFLDHSITSRVFLTALLRTVGRPSERAGYVKAARAARREAKAYAEVFCSRYFEFQSSWPQILGILENSPQLKALFGSEAGEGLTSAEQPAPTEDTLSVEQDEALETPPSFPQSAPLTDYAPPEQGARPEESAPLRQAVPAEASASRGHVAVEEDSAPSAGPSAELLDFELDLRALGLED